MECAICLSTIKPTDKITKLPCDHVFHHKCFFTHAYKSVGSVLAKCPLCRKINTEFPEPCDNVTDNLMSLSSCRNRCCHTTTSGTVCKKRALPFNYGYCKFHHPSVLPALLYEPFYEYLKYILISANNWRTKVYMMDIAKQLCMKHTIKNAMDLHIFFLSYFQYVRFQDDYDERDPASQKRDPKELYEYYDLIYPPEQWIKKCIEERVVI